MTMNQAALMRSPLYGKRLTDHEVEILTMVSFGLGDEQIAARIYVSSSTVKTHLRNMAAKLGTRNRAHMVRLGFVHGYLRIPAKDGDVQDRVGA